MRPYRATIGIPPFPANGSTSEQAAYRRMSVNDYVRYAQKIAYSYRPFDGYRGSPYNRVTNKKVLDTRLCKEDVNVFLSRAKNGFPRSDYVKWRPETKDTRFLMDMADEYQFHIDYARYQATDHDDAFIAQVIRRTTVAHRLAANRDPGTLPDYLAKVCTKMAFGLNASFSLIDNMKIGGFRDDCLSKREEFMRKIKDLPIEAENLFCLHAELEAYLTDHSHSIVDFNERMQEDYRPFKNDYRNKIIKNKWGMMESKFIALRIVSSRTMAIIEIDGDARVFPYAAVVELHNKVTDLLSVLVYSHFAAGTYLPEQAAEAVIDTIHQMSEAFLNSPTSYYDLAKSLEALSVGIIIDKVETYPNREFLDQLITSITTGSEECGETIGYNTRRLVKTWEMYDIPLVAELGCLGKILGHPIRTVEPGIKKQYKRVQAQKEIDPAATQAVANKLKMLVIRSYYQSKEHQYPPLTSLGGSFPPRLEEAIRRKIWVGDAQLNHHPPFTEEDLTHVTFEQFEEVDLIQTLLTTLSDKSLSPLRDVVLERFDLKNSEEFGDMIGDDLYPEGGGATSRHETKAILYYLMTELPEVEHKPFVEAIASGRKTFADFLIHMVVKYHPKEEELKPEYRMFGGMTWLMRAYNQVVLKYCKGFLRRYMPEQAIELDEIESNKKTSSFVSSASKVKGCTPLFLSLDVQGWNTNFRAEVIQPIMEQTLDAITGTKLFSHAHLMFHYSVFFIETPEKSYIWRGQGGGVEGFHQELWMIVYIAQIHYALRSVQFSAKVICKGDDVRISFLIPQAELASKGVEEIAARLKKILKEELGKLGHPVKEEECYYSSRFFSFSKKMSVDGVSLPSMFRQIQKCYGGNNAYSESLVDYVGAAFSSAHAACAYGVNHVPAYLMALFWSAIPMQDDPRFSQMPVEQFCAYFFIPSVVGGFSIIYLDNFMTRAESDFLASFNAAYAILRKSHPRMADYMRGAYHQSMDSKASILLLAQDPYALNILRPDTAQQVMSRWTLNALREYPKNQEFVEITQAASSVHEEAFLEGLWSAEPYDAKAASAIYGRTVFHMLRSFIKKFDKSQTLIDFIIKMEMGGLRKAAAAHLFEIECATQNEIMYIAALTTLPASNMLITMLNPDTFHCPAAHAEHIRTVCWGRVIHGVTHPPVIHQLVIGFPGDPQMAAYSLDHFRNTTVKTPPVHPAMARPQFASAAAPPAYGGTTPAGREAAPKNPPRKDEIGAALGELLYLPHVLMLEEANECPPEYATAMDVCNHAMAYYTDLTRDQLDPFTAKRSQGTRDHHLPCAKYRLTIAYNGLKNQSQLGFDIVDTNKKFRATGENYRINFLHLRFIARTLAFEHWNYSNTSNVDGELWSGIRHCSECFFTLVEKDMWFTSPEVFDSKPSTIGALKSQIEANSIGLAQYLEELHGSYEIRSIREQATPTLEEATEVLVSEMVRKEITYLTTVSQVHEIHDPDPTTLADAAAVFLRGKQISPVGNLVLTRMPMKSVFEGSFDVIANFLLAHSHGNLYETAYTNLITARGDNLPWASFVAKVCDANCGLALLAAAADRAHISLDAVRAARANPGLAATFIGQCVLKILRTEHTFPLPSAKVRLHTPSHIIERSLESKVRSGCTNFIIHEEFPRAVQRMRETRGPGLLVLSEAALRAVTIVVLLHTSPRITVEEISASLQDYDGPVLLDWIPGGIERLTRQAVPIPGMAPPWARSLLDRMIRMGGIQWARWRDWVVEAYDSDSGSRVKDADLVEVRLFDTTMSLAIVKSSVRQPGLNDFEASQELPRCLARDEHCVSEVGYKVLSGIRYITNLRMAAIGGFQEPYLFSFAVSGPTLFDLTHLSRYGGFGTTSVIKLIRILEGVKFTKKDRDLEGDMVCFGDGRGGDSRYLCERYPRCKIHWNSLESLKTRVGPVAAYRPVEGDEDAGFPPNLRFVNQMNFGGDLTKKFVMEEMEKEANRPILVKCDADIPQDDTRGEVARVLWRNVCLFFIRNGHEGSVLILKVFVDLADLVSSVIASLQQHMKFVRLVRVAESHVGYERYIIANSISRRGADPFFFTAPDGNVIRTLSSDAEAVNMSFVQMDNLEVVMDEKRCLAYLSYVTPDRLPPASSAFIHSICPEYHEATTDRQLLVLADEHADALAKLARAPKAEFGITGASSKTLGHRVNNFILLIRVRAFASLLRVILRRLPIQRGVVRIPEMLKVDLWNSVFRDPVLLDAFMTFPVSSEERRFIDTEYVVGTGTRLNVRSEVVRAWKAAASYWGWRFVSLRARLSP